MRLVRQLSVLLMGIAVFITATGMGTNLEEGNVLIRSRALCNGAVAFYAKSDTGKVLLKELNYDARSMSPRELNIAHALENEILLLFLRKGYYLESIECNCSEKVEGKTQRILLLASL